LVFTVLLDCSWRRVWMGSRAYATTIES